MFVADIFRSLIWGEQNTQYSRRQVRPVESGVVTLARNFFAVLTAVSGCAFIAYPNPATALIFGGLLVITVITYIATSPNSSQTSRTYRPAPLYSAPPQTTTYSAPTYGSRNDSSYSSFNSAHSYSPPQAELPTQPPMSYQPAPQQQVRGNMGDNGKRAGSDRTTAGQVATAALQDMVSGSGQRSEPPAAPLSYDRVTAFAPQAAPVLASQERGNLGNNGVRAAEPRVNPPLLSSASLNHPSDSTSSSYSGSSSRASVVSAQAIVQQSQLRGNLGNDGVRQAAPRVSPPPPSAPTFSQPPVTTSFSSSSSQSKATAASVQAAVQQSQLRGNLGNDGVRSQDSLKRSHDNMSTAAPPVFIGAQAASSSTNAIGRILDASRQATSSAATNSSSSVAASSSASQARGEVGRREREKTEAEAGQTQAPPVNNSDPNARGQVGRRGKRE